MYSRSWRPSVVVAMPCYEEEGIVEFIDEIRSYLSAHVESLRFVVVDDCSRSVHPRDLLQKVHHEVVRVESNLRNLGHGPTVMSAYAHALMEPCDVVLHVDGDGQFIGEDFVRVLAELRHADVVIGERTGRTDPWFRQLLTWGLRTGVRRRAGTVRDINSPLRAYRRRALAELHSQVPPASVVPHVVLTLRMAELGMETATVPVHHRPRRGDSTCGTMWGSTRWSQVLPSRRLLRLCMQALREVSGEGRRGEAHRKKLVEQAPPAAA